MSFHFPGSRPEVKHSEGSYIVSLLPTYAHMFDCLFKFPNSVLGMEFTEILGLCSSDSFSYQEWRQAVTSAPPAQQSSTIYGYRPPASTIPSGPASSMMPPEPRPPIVLTSEPSPRFIIKSAFARLTSAMLASATAFSSKLGRIFNKKTKA